MEKTKIKVRHLLIWIKAKQNKPKITTMGFCIKFKFPFIDPSK